MELLRRCCWADLCDLLFDGGITVRTELPHPERPGDRLNLITVIQPDGDVIVQLPTELAGAPVEMAAAASLHQRTVAQRMAAVQRLFSELGLACLLGLLLGGAWWELPVTTAQWHHLVEFALLFFISRLRHRIGSWLFWRLAPRLLG